jgi:ribosome-binding factor A
MTHKRTDRLNDQIRMEIAEILRTEVRDPRIGFVTITSVHVSPDLRQARVYVTVLKSEEDSADQDLEGLKKAAPFIRGELGRRIRLRNVPELIFHLDRSIEEGDRVLKLLDEIRGG